MRQDIVKQLDGYEEIMREIEISRKYGLVVDVNKGSASEYIRRLHPSVMDLRVNQVIRETVSTKTLRLVSSDGYLPPFQAGQYIALYLDIDGIRTGRPYSISSAPNQTGYYDITVRRMNDGLVSNYLMDRVKAGDMIQSSGPEGRFAYNPLIYDKTLVFIAGGSGITPFMSMIREIAGRGLDREVFMFYGNRTEEDVIFHSELKELSGWFDNIHYIPVIQYPEGGYKGHAGFISGKIILNEIKDISKKTFMLCGPQALYDFCVPELTKIGVPPKKIHREIYGEPLNIYDSPGWPKSVNLYDTFTINISGAGAFKACAGKSLLSSLEKNGFARLFVCRSGECSLCRLRVVSGKVYQPPGALVRASDRRFGYVHSCVAYPLSDLEILL
jgi:glycine betaine catabolism B